MAVAPALRQLLRIRLLEEEQAQLALEAATQELHRLENALVATRDRDRAGRLLVQRAASTGEIDDRIAGLEESRMALRLFDWLGPQIEMQQQVIADHRAIFMAKRVERRQAETLIEEAEAREAVEQARRSQQALDDWFQTKTLFKEREERRRQRQANQQSSNISAEIENT